MRFRSLFCVFLLLISGVRAANDAAPPADPLRLTRDVVPVAQAVALTVDPARDDYTGTARIDLVVVKASDSFRLHSLGPVVTSASVADSSGRSVVLKAEVTEAKIGLVTLTAPMPLAPGSYVLSLAFTAKFTRDGLGLYKTVSRGDSYLFTQFEDQHARRAFPCWDEPSFKIPWQLTLTVPVAQEAVTNYPVAQESSDAAAGTKTLYYGRTPPMPSYLVAMAVGPFEYTPVPGLAVPGRIIAPRGQKALSAEAAVLSPPLLRGLEEYFGTPYPYAKLDQIGVPEYVYGAMENAGLITYRDTGLLLDPTRASFSSRRSLTHVITHEMAHMWFGDLVTMTWWDDLWLNESFADWMAAKIVDRVHPEMRTEIGEVANADIALRADAQPSVRPVRRVVLASNVGMEDPELIYNKGKAILRMIEGWIGEDNFRHAMQAYFQKHKWGNTTAADLWSAFDAASGENVSAMLAAFIEKPGVPLVAFSFLPDGKLQLTQSRFYNLAADNPGGAGTLWQVPVTFSWSAKGKVRHERVLLREASQVVDIPGLAEAEWIFPNTGQTGYYRWTLPPAYNTRLAAKAATALSTSERLGLLNNAAASLDSGRLAGADYLAFLAAFARDEEPEVVQRVAAGLERVRDLFVSAKQVPAFNALRLAFLRPALDRIGLTPKAGEPPHVAPLRTVLLDALGTEPAAPDVIALARKLTADFLRDPASVEPALTTVAVSVAAYHGDAALFDSFAAMLGQTKTPAARAAVITGLTGFKDPALAQRALDLSLTPTLNSVEFLRAPTSLAGTGELRPMVVDWFMAHYEEIKAKGAFNRVASSINLAGNDPLLFDKLKTFFADPSRTDPRIQSNVTKATDRLTLSTRLREKETKAVEEYIKTFPAGQVKDGK